MELIEEGLRLVEATDLGVLQSVCNALVQAGAQSLCVLAADGNNTPAEQLDQWLKGLPVTVFGGLFPQIIHGQRNLGTGYVVAALRSRCTVSIVSGLSNPGADFSAAVEAARGGLPPAPSVLVLVDGLSSQIGAFLDGVYDVLGSATTFFGGGAGSLSFRQQPCLFTNQGFLQDHAILVDIPSPTRVAVEHGWEKFAGPFVVTGADGNVVHSLDYQPAYDFYRGHVERDSGTQFNADNFFSIAKGYPIGMEKADGSIVVRDPISHDGQHLVCVGEVPNNSVAYLLKGRPQRLVQAAADCANHIGPGKTPALLVDCISRVLYLEDRYGEELRAVESGLQARAVFGMLSLGEIANGGSYCLEFFNKTLVLAAGE
ncbi:FIST N-terminal domain-containing protein [Curvibacter sp. APW13]|uniref:FIST signal transduction protein n=1 Tax=Curvibacter sp. APW13 TaxID=3077236 RepID=UPI0028DDBDBD|nr:FIST N-terminal domain-containing protein [Curvibacter sp. APW13]MDT8991528.1 FIST N-terminal domain-containing protein [Curvibacter sp. APW13]